MRTPALTTDRSASARTGLQPSIASVAFAGLWLAAGLARFGLLTHGFRLRLSELLGLLILGGVLLISGFRFPIPWPAAIYPLIYVAMETLSTLVNPGDWSRGFKLDILLGVEAVLAIGAAALVSVLDFRTIARTIVGAGAVAATVAIGLTALYHLHLTSFGVQVDPVTGLCKTYGTMYEANLLGSYLAASLVFSLVVGRYLGAAWFSGGSRALMVVGIGLTVSRAIWFAVLVGAVLLLALAVLERTRLRPRQLITLILGTALTLGVWAGLLELANGHPCGPVRASEISTQGSISGRFASHALALAEWSSSGLFGEALGLGTGSTKAHLPNDPNQPWISSQAVAALHDTGVVGFVLVFGLLALLLLALIRWHRPSNSQERWLRYGLAAAILTLLVAFQATTGTLMEFPWLFLGTALGVLFAPRAAAREVQVPAARTA